DLPVSLAVWIMLGHGTISVLLRRGEPYLDSLTMLVALLLVGRMLEARGRTRAALEASSLGAQLPGVVRRVVGDTIEAVAPDALQVGDLVAVASGEEIGADGIVVEGEATIDTALMTGESEPRSAREGSIAMAG